MTTDVVKFHKDVPVEFYQWEPLEIDYAKHERSKYVHQVIAPTATPAEWAGFVEVANRFRLNPLQNPRPIWLINYGGKNSIAQPQIGIAGYRIFAERSGRYAGSTEPEWCGQPKDEDAPLIWRTAWLWDKPPAAARVGVFARGMALPVWGLATFREFAKYQNDGNTKRLRDLWRDYPSLMLSKCAEKQALCKAFPEQLSEAEALNLFSEGEAPRFSVERGAAGYRQSPYAINGVALPQLPAGWPSSRIEDLYPRDDRELEPAVSSVSSPTTEAPKSEPARAERQAEPGPKREGKDPDGSQAFWARVRQSDINLDPRRDWTDTFGHKTPLGWLNEDKARTWASALRLLESHWIPQQAAEEPEPAQPSEPTPADRFWIRAEELGYPREELRATIAAQFDGRPLEEIAEEAGWPLLLDLLEDGLKSEPTQGQLIAAPHGDPVDQRGR